jgi:N-acetylneuraminic acid mutarotase
VGLVALAVALVALLLSNGGSRKVASPPSSPSTTHPANHVAASAASASQTIPAVEAGYLPWTLGAPLSRESVLPGAGTTVTLAGGLSTGNAPVKQVISLDTATGQVSAIGALPSGVASAAAARAGKDNLILGGNGPATGSGATAQTVRLGSAVAGSPTTPAVAGALPRPRTGAAAVTLGDKAYIVGGADGTKADPEVLATSDGTHFTSVAALPVPVRDPAVAAIAGKIYVLGGDAVRGDGAGSPVDVIQVVDPRTHTAKRIGRLPMPLAGAAAAVIDGHLYVAGGVTTASGASTGFISEASAPAHSASSPSGSDPAGTAVADVWAFDVSQHRLLQAGSLPAAIANAGVAVVGPRAWLIGGEEQGTPVSSVEMFTPNPKFGTAGAPGAGSPFFGGKLLIADRGNNRLLLLDDTDQVVWSYPSAYASAPPGGFYFPDDAFFTKDGTEIISNQENNETVVIIAFPSGQLLWQYGHPGVATSQNGYLSSPDDSYLLKNGQVVVADDVNCRLLVINPDKTVAHQIGTNNVCQHDPPNYLGSPNGDTPLADGNILISEINGSWIDEYTLSGQLVWTVQLPSVAYVSDPQQIGPDLYLVSDYSNPQANGHLGQIVEFNRAGQILYRYAPASGPGELNRPSLTELLPSGVFMSNDDYRDRMIAVDPATQALVWQYGVTDTPGTGPGMLSIPDGFDVLDPGGVTPTHLPTA